LTKAQHSVIPDSGTSSKLASVFQASSDSLKGKEFQVCMNFPCTVNALTSLKSCRYIITNFTSVLYLLIALQFSPDFSAKVSALLPPSSLGHYTILVLPHRRRSEGERTGREGSHIFVSQHRHAVVQTGPGKYTVSFP